MFKFKYYDGIKAAQERTKRDGVDMQTPFDLATLGPDTWRTRLTHRLFDLGIKYAFMALRRFRPVLKVGPLIIVSRAADVRKILADPAHFGVPFGPEMTELAGGSNFVLGLEDEPHADQRATIQKVVRHSDVTLLETVSRETATALAGNARGRLDIIKDGFTRVGTEACFAYFGLSASDPDAFADWTLSISALLFADPFGKPATRELALKGAEGVRRVIDLSMSRTTPNDDTLLGRLLALKATDPALTNAGIRAILVGLVTGFIPTTTLAAGRIIDELLRRPIAFDQAQKTARAGEKERLKAMLMEASRLNPALSPGQWRFTRKARTIVDSAGRRTEAEKGDVVLVSTASALVDSAEIDNPYGFDASRGKKAYALAFGLDPHECIGKEVAITVITEIAAVLFALPGFKPAEGSTGRLGWCGAFPRRLDFVFEPRTPAGFAMPTFAIPVLAKVDASALQSKIEALGNPAKPDVQAAADGVGTLHFVSASLLDLGSETEKRPHIFIEANADGDEAQVTEAVARAFGASLGPIAAQATGSPEPFADLLKRFTIRPTTLPVGATGLDFPGLPDFSTDDIERESRLAAFARDAVDAYLTMKIGRSARAFDVLDFVRRLIRPDGAARVEIAADASGRLADLARRGAAFAPDILLPSRRRLTMMDWTQPSASSVAKAILLDRTDLLTVKIPYLVFALAIAYRNFEPRFAKHGLSLSFTSGADILKAIIAGAIGALIPFVLVALAAAFWLWRLESRDVADDREPSLDKISSAAKVEDEPGYAQNHFTSVSDMKPGFFRRATLGAALWAIKELVIRYYRPGFVIDLGTINFARWLRPAGANKLVFFSNFDGSWHSYLEDFITKAHMGQSAVWSNGQGFPKTSWLIYGGANDGDRFKRWVRRQQVVTQFWYARFPGLAADVKRANGVIRFGLARASDETEARDWLSQFGSYAPPDGVVESAEVQSIVFRAYQRLPYATYALVRLPEDRARLGKWLAGLVGGLDGVASNEQGLEVAFGDKPLEPDAHETPAAFIAFTAQGLVRAGFPSERPGQKSTSFPGAFNLGMATRGRILGDLGASASEHWRWSDCDEHADALLIGYGATPEASKAVIDRHEAALGQGSILNRLVSQPTAKGPGFEPFGFRDGLSQPVIRGTRRAAKGAPARDLMAPGEFLLGYRNNSGYFPLSPGAPAACDPANRLPTYETAARPDLPSLDGSTAMRDFGRNGTFIAVRQLKQDVDGFHAQAKRLAGDLAERPGAEGALGAPPTAELIEAKMMGRWHDGTPLIGQPPKKPADRPSNDFDFRNDDAEGFRCPVGAHIRRANPRAALTSSSKGEDIVVARHRLLRRGRPYADSEGPGIVFVGICADLERQFEFVQQSWIDDPGFLSLRNEPDPISGAATQSPRTFTLPTPEGPICLNGLQPLIETRGGGYFFAPSLSALAFLADMAGLPAEGTEREPDPALLVPNIANQ